MTTRYYTNTASQATLASGVGTTDTTITLTAGSYSGYPTSFPFSAAIARGTSSEELVLVTAASGNTLTVTRGYDSSTVSAHGAGSTFVHVITAQDLRDVQAATAAADAANTAAGTAQTALTTHTSATSAHGVTGAVVGTTDTQVLTNKTLKGAVLQDASGNALSYVPTSQVGAASGVASLDATGKVPASQIPTATAAAPIVARLTSGAATVNTTVAADVAGLQLDGLTPGLWLVEFTGRARAAAAYAMNGSWVPTNGLVLAATADPATGTSSGTIENTYLGSSGGSAAAITATASSIQSGGAVLNGGSTSTLPFVVRGALRVTTGGSLKVRAFLSAAGTGYIDLGSTFSATRIGS